MKRAPALALLLAGCLPVEIPQTPSRAPLTLPLADGRGSSVTRAPFDYVISRAAKPHGFEFRVTRQGRDLRFDEGRVAKLAAEAWCAQYNRSFSATALGRFSVPNAWVFDGDCA